MKDTNTEKKELPQMGSKRVAVVLGRFNPPTRGHYKIISSIRKFIKNNPKLNLESSPVVVVIGNNKSDMDKKNNPLTVDERILFMKSSGHADGVIFLTAENAFKGFAELRDHGYEPIAIAVGSDRKDQYMKILDEYFFTNDGKPIKHYQISLDRDNVASKAKTKKDDENKKMDDILNSKEDDKIDVGNISGSLARRAIELGYKEEFADIVGLSDKPKLASKMFSKIKSAMEE